MPECPICRQTYDGRFQVFVSDHGEAFDTIACARRAATAGISESLVPVPAVLPTIEVLPRLAPVESPAVPARRGSGVLAALAAQPTQIALAAGVGLIAAGTAASVYLAVEPGHSPSVAAGAGRTHATTVPRRRIVKPAAPPHAAIGAATVTTAAIPASVAQSRSRGSLAPSGSAQSSPPASSSSRTRTGAPSAAQAQYGQYEPPFSST
jgi:hypothetical protein